MSFWRQNLITWHVGRLSGVFGLLHFAVRYTGKQHGARLYVYLDFWTAGLERW